MKLAADRVLTPEEAVEHYGPLVLRTAFGLVKNMQDAEDIAQEVFLTLLKKTRPSTAPTTSRPGCCAAPSTAAKATSAACGRAAPTAWTKP